MPAFHQMGHDSENLLWAEELAQYRGAILSPVNYDQAKGRLNINFTDSVRWCNSISVVCRCV